MATSNRSMSEAPIARAQIELVDLNTQQKRIRARLDAAIDRVLEHGQYIMGPEVAELEAELGKFCGAKHAITCASGTDALMIAMMAKGIGPGDAVLCPAFTYTATPETIVLLGATPVFVDVEPGSFNIDATGVAEGIAKAKAHGLKPSALIAVDLFGLPADYPRLREVTDAEGMWVLADAAQSFGATAHGRKAGTLGDITATSFFPAKPLGCYGDGGALFTDDGALAEVMRSIRLHGKGGDKYDIVRIGVNGRLDTLQAAVLIEKLRIFADEIAARQVVAQRYGYALHNVVKVPSVPTGSTSVWAQFTVNVPGGRRDALAHALKAQGIPTAIYYPKPVHQQPAYARFPTASPSLAISEQLPNEVLSLPMHAYLSPAEQDRIIAAVHAAL
jgi:UDP-2-acetamido-2-deoxy-ribo-hexuluronate aminotransferase